MFLLARKAKAKGAMCAILAKSKICQKGKNGKSRLQWAR